MTYLDQHFLENEEILKSIAESLQTTSQDILVEIGAGKGALSKYLIKKQFNELYLIEKDSQLKQNLQTIVGDTQNCNIIIGNSLEELEKFSQAKIIGNIPYGITEPLYMKCMDLGIRETVFLQSKQFYTTITSRKHSKWFYIVPAFFHIEHIKDISGDNFAPPTKVTSSVVSLTLKTNLTSQEKFWQAFYHKFSRNLKNALKYSLIDGFGYTKKQADKIINKYPLLSYEKKTSNLSNEEFLQIVSLLEQENILEN